MIKTFLGRSSLTLWFGVLLFLSGSALWAAEPVAAPFSVKVTGAGRAMLLIPGLASGGEVWDGTVAHFQDRYACHVFTLAGFAGQPAVPAPVVEHFRDGIVRYLEEQKLDHPIIIGHSLGGFLAFWIAATVPDKVGPIISVDGAPAFAALRDATATPASTEPLAKILRAATQAQTPAQFSATNRAMLDGMILEPKERARMAAVGEKSDPKAVGQALYELMTTDLRPELVKIRTPVLFLGATANIAEPAQKTATEANYRAQVQTIPNHTVIFAPKAHHFIQLDEPEFFYQQVETFLRPSNP